MTLDAVIEADRGKPAGSTRRPSGSGVVNVRRTVPSIKLNHGSAKGNKKVSVSINAKGSALRLGNFALRNMTRHPVGAVSSKRKAPAISQDGEENKLNMSLEDVIEKEGTTVIRTARAKGNARGSFVGVKATIPRGKSLVAGGRGNAISGKVATLGGKAKTRGTKDRQGDKWVFGRKQSCGKAVGEGTSGGGKLPGANRLSAPAWVQLTTPKVNPVGAKAGGRSGKAKDNRESHQESWGSGGGGAWSSSTVDEKKGGGAWKKKGDSAKWNTSGGWKGEAWKDSGSSNDNWKDKKTNSRGSASGSWGDRKDDGQNWADSSTWTGGNSGRQSERNDDDGWGNSGGKSWETKGGKNTWGGGSGSGGSWKSGHGSGNGGGGSGGGASGGGGAGNGGASKWDWRGDSRDGDWRGVGSDGGVRSNGGGGGGDRGGDRGGDSRGDRRDNRVFDRKWDDQPRSRDKWSNGSAQANGGGRGSRGSGSSAANHGRDSGNWSSVQRGRAADSAEPPARRGGSSGGTSKRIKVTNIPTDLDWRAIKEAFEAETGEILRCDVQGGTLWIDYKRGSDALKAVETFDLGELNNRTIHVELVAS
eukprot:TRINITY_DN49488_c0_g1_i1.p1 TRINITY_DN49488_c0_g1~~TRINITY_DN49488_c0_g1_i1.p1  ORF type:complete len:645 (+),score=110.98 TRINITY_DN49488_c0_g1_i1:174-1937(+)